MIEPTKVYQPAYVSINNKAEERSLSLWHVSPTEMVKLLADVFHVCRFIVLKVTLLHVDFGALYNHLKFATFL